MPYPLPTIINPPDTICLMIPVPNEVAYLAAVDGALLGTAQWKSWARDPANRGTQAATRMRQAYNAMTYGSCVAADIYRINPSDGCQIQVSHDGGATWELFWDVSACFNALSGHFLVDNPGVVRENGVNPLSGHFGLFIVANDQTGIGVDAIHDFPAVDLYQASTDDAALPPLRLGRAAGGRGYIELVRGVTRRDAISYDMLFRAPIASAMGLNDQNVGGIYVRDIDNRAYVILPNGSGGYHQVRIGSGDGSGDGSLNTLTPSYTELSAGATPRLLITGSEDTRNIDLGLPPFADEFTLNPEYHELDAGSTPEIAITPHSDTGVIDLDLRLPSIPLPDFPAGDYHELAIGATPEIAVSVAEHTDRTDTTFDLRLPPIPNPYALYSPLHAGSNHVSMTVESYGTWLPFLVPNGSVIEHVSTLGQWAAMTILDGQAFVGDGTPIAGTEENENELRGTKTSGARHTGGYFDVDLDHRWYFPAGQTFTEDCYVRLDMVLGTAINATGHLLVDFDIVLPTIFDWTVIFAFASSAYTSNWHLVEGNYVGGVGWQTSDAEWTLKTRSALVGHSGLCRLQRVEMHSATLHPMIVSAPKGNRVYIAEGGLDLDDPAAANQSSAISVWDGIGYDIPTDGRGLNVDSISADHATGGVNDQQQTYSYIKFQGDGTAPDFIAF